jgi:biopolymer transport protein ExbD
MKLKGAKQVHYDSGPNMTPLVDVVMVILIFLMLAGSFGATSHYLTSKSTVGGGNSKPQEPKPGETPDEIFEIAVLPDATYGFRVRAGDIDSKGRAYDRQWLIQQFEQKMAQYQKANTSIDKIQVVLAPSGSVSYDSIARVYETVLAAKFKKVAFKTTS